MRRSKKYPKSTAAWMAELGYADLTGFPRFVRDAVLAARVPTRWRGRLFAPMWVVRVYRVLEHIVHPNGIANVSLTWIRDDFIKVLRSVQKDPDAFDEGTAASAYRLGGKDALLAVLGAR